MRSENPEVQVQSTNENTVHRVVLPFEDQKSADTVRKQLSDLSNKINHTLQSVFKSHKICEDLKMCEPKPPIITFTCKTIYLNLSHFTCIFYVLSKCYSLFTFSSLKTTL